MNKSNKNLKSNLEKIFVESSSTDHLFDAFQLLIFNKIDDMDLIRILLANPCLSIDELIMFCEKAAKEFSHLKYEIYIWTGYVFESKFNCAEYSLNYYKKAFEIDNKEYAPLICALGLYKFDYPLPTNKLILEFVENNAHTVKKRSKVYYELSKLFEELGNKEKYIKYKELSDRSALTEDD